MAGPWQLSFKGYFKAVDTPLGGVTGWDLGVAEASEIYSHRIHNLFCDNCHSHVAQALDIMNFRGKTNWNMFVLCFMVFFKAKFVG